MGIHRKMGKANHMKNKNDSNQKEISDTGYESNLRKYDFVKHINDYLHGYIKFADTKAGVIIALSIGFITILFNQKIHEPLFKMCKGQLFNNLLFYLTIVTFLSIMIGLFFAISVIFPRTSPQRTKSLIFWENILEHKKEEYKTKIKELNTQEIIDSLSEHNYLVASVSNQKYKGLKVSMIFSFVGIILGLVCLVIK